MLKIGLTGGIGSGKSIVAKAFEMLGVPVYNSDLRAKHLMNTNPDIRKQLITCFGKGVYNGDSTINRKYLAERIFKNKESLSSINEIVHPVVRKDFATWCEENKNVQYVIQESAILFDTGLYKNFDKIITVSADEEIRIQRVVSRDSVSEDSVLERIKNQLAEEERINKSDFVIYNTSELILPQIDSIDKEIRLLARK